MRKTIFSVIITLPLLFCNNSYSQDTISKTKTSFPKNYIKFNFLPLFVHTLSISYERKFTKRFSLEVEGGYIFPVGPIPEFPPQGYHYYRCPKNGNPNPIWTSQGFLGRGSLRYYLWKNEHGNFMLFAGASFLYKYRYYKNKIFYYYDGNLYSHTVFYKQSEINKAYAGEAQFGLRYFPTTTHHLLLEISLGFGYGSEHRSTDVKGKYIGSPGDLSYGFVPFHTEQTLPYYSFNPCFKLGYAF